MTLRWYHIILAITKVETRIQTRTAYRISSFKHKPHVCRRRRACGRTGASGGPSASPEHGRKAGRQCLIADLRTDEVHVRVHAASGDYEPFSSDRLRVHTADHARGDSLHDIGIACLSDSSDATIFDSDVCLVDTSMIDDQGVGDHSVELFASGDARGLAHAFSQHLPASELALITVHSEVLLHPDVQLGIGEADYVTSGRAEHVRVQFAGNIEPGIILHCRIVLATLSGGIVGSVRVLEILRFQACCNCSENFRCLGYRAIAYVVAALDDLVASDTDERDSLDITRLKAYGGSSSTK